MQKNHVYFLLTLLFVPLIQSTFVSVTHEGIQCRTALNIQSRVREYFLKMNFKLFNFRALSG